MRKQEDQHIHAHKEFPQVTILTTNISDSSHNMVETNLIMFYKE